MSCISFKDCSVQLRQSKFLRHLARSFRLFIFGSDTVVIFLLSSSLEQQGIPYRAAKQICIKGRVFQKGESFSHRASFQALAQCEAQQSEGINCLVVKSSDMLTIWREIPRHNIVLPSSQHSSQYSSQYSSHSAQRQNQKSIESETFFNRSPISSPERHPSKTAKAKPTKHDPRDIQRLLDWKYG